MLRIGFISLMAILAPFAASGAAPAGTTASAVASATPVTFGKPFWEGKPQLEQKLREERAVLVSVRTDKGEIDKSADLFTINGVGYVKRDAETVFQLARQFDHLKEISDVFREVKYDAKTSRVFVICEALGYQARMLIHVEPSKEPVREIRFKVVDGHFLGLEGVLGVKELPAASVANVASGAGGGAPLTEVSFRVRHEAREIPIPRVLVGFALEVLVQKVAIKMRAHFEEAARPPAQAEIPLEAKRAEGAADEAGPSLRTEAPIGAWKEARPTSPAVKAPVTPRSQSTPQPAARPKTAPQKKSAP